ncbi:DUF2510 domain-containing protein [Agromyces sp. ZXT2-6]|uniref:DUF2510 domain-containing protein n=1 Tax=Agromyces sp. ZXT2-6 TaxID=3461153 RepID=UPI004054C255
MTSPTRVPGWHPDETDAALLRYWDGSGWTPHTAARTGTSAEAAPHRTVRLAEPGAASASDHTTVPTPPAAGGDRIAVARTGALPAGGTVTAAAAIVVATAALAVALLR